MFDLYPNILARLSAASQSADADGDYPLVGEIETEHSICRAVRNGSGQVVTLSAGKEYRFGYVVYMPSGTNPIKLGTGVKVYDRDTGGLLACGDVMDFVSSPLGCKLWL